MITKSKWCTGIARFVAMGAGAMIGTPALAAVPEMTVNNGDTAFMIISTVLVFLMIVPGLALFYGGMVRQKNVLSIVSQVLGILSVAILVWVCWGYSLAFGDGNAFVGGLNKLFLSGITGDTLAATFTEGVGIPELVFIAFQATFAAITAAIIVGSLAERVKFSALMIFTLIWLTIVYAPIAHMVWHGDGLIFGWGALDFAGGTVVHINAGVAGVVGVLFAGRRVGFLKEMLPPHSLPLTLIGTGLLWGGWVGFNAGSNLEATGGAAIALLNTFIAPAAGVITWMIAERIVSGKPSFLGGASGAVAGLVAITPAAGLSGFMGAIFLGAVTSAACYWFVGSLKNKLKFDDSLDAFGIHGVGGIVGSIGTGIVAAPALGGFGAEGYDMGAQVVIQIQAVLVAIAWSAIGSAIAFGIVKAIIGLRVSEEAEREGLDLNDHGERAYNV